VPNKGPEYCLARARECDAEADRTADADMAETLRYLAREYREHAVRIGREEPRDVAPFSGNS
jgi:hypothetical protein